MTENTHESEDVELGDLRIVIETDEDGLQEIHSGGYSDIKEIIHETREKIANGTWDCYLIKVEQAAPGGWEVVNAIGSNVYASGWLGTYTSVDKITDEQLRDGVQQVWDEAMGLLKPQRPSSKPRLIFNAGEFRDLDRELREDRPYPMRLVDGTEIEIVAGDPATGRIGVEHADLDEIRITGTSL